MLPEHAKGRELIKEMETAISGKEEHERFTRAAKEYSSLLRDHIEKENCILFPSAEKALTGAQLDRMHDEFEQFESKVIGAGRHEELHAVLKCGFQKLWPQ